MTYRQDITVPAELMEQVAEQGLKILLEPIRIVSIFPNPASCLRLVSAALAEISEEWLTGAKGHQFARNRQQMI